MTSAHADVITANILAEIIVELAPALAHHLAPDGILIASGILADKADLVDDALCAVGLRVIETTREEDWLVMVGKSRESTVNRRVFSDDC